MFSKFRQRLAGLLFLVPYIYLALLLDFKHHSILGFILVLFLAITGGFYFKLTAQLPLLVFGNLFSATLSYLFCISHPAWHYFYQPFDPSLLVLLLSALYMIPQLIGIFWASFFTAYGSRRPSDHIHHKK